MFGEIGRTVHQYVVGAYLLLLLFVPRLDLWLQISDRDLCGNCFGQLFYGISD